MINLKAIGQVFFFAIPILIFGIQYLTYGRFVRGLPPVPPWAPGGAAAYLTVALLVEGLMFFCGQYCCMRRGYLLISIIEMS